MPNHNSFDTEKENSCLNCKHDSIGIDDYPCTLCNNRDKWEPIDNSDSLDEIWE